MTQQVKCPTCGWHTTQLLKYPSELPTFSFPEKYEAKCRFQCLQVNCLSVFEYTLEMRVPESKDPLDVTMRIPRQTLEDVFINALEGGSNYWYWLDDETIDLVREAVSEEEERYIAVAIFKAAYDKGVDVPIHDAENPEEVLGVLSRSTMNERLQALASGPQKWALDNEMQENGDASSSDIVFQYLVLGEVVFG
jgi:hypothetical protein